MRTLFILAAMLAFGGCATVQTNPPPAAASKSAVEAASASCRQSLADAALDPVRRKTVLTTTDRPTSEMLADESRITATEKPAVARWSNKVVECQKVYRSVILQYYPPLLVANTDSFYSASGTLRPMLYNGLLTWGQFNQARQQLASEFLKTNDEIQTALQRQDPQAAVLAQQTAAINYTNLVQSTRRANCGSARSGKTAQPDCL